MSSILSSQGMALATAMAVSGTVIFLAAFRLQKSPSFSDDDSSTSHFSLLSPPSCIITSEDVVDPIGNSDEYRKLHSNNNSNNNSIQYSNKGGKVRKMPANRVALYNGILRDKVIHRVAYSH
ncbi:hypothetical protein BUALT_Bualt16G0069500 [Buddleja alternifolia]|uniref:Uncharacterized protein n=1 Tax=Buddleja alternifolia TaxID=168488 RepID=A0AAV6WF40_9LAMI|nr:hypothetical protein BUALT_Bualt16G0069500 [Buddleja alternifolia]